MPCWHIPADSDRLQGANVFFLVDCLSICFPSECMAPDFSLQTLNLIIMYITRVFHVQGYTAIELILSNSYFFCGFKLRDNNLSDCQVTLTTGRINLSTQRARPKPKTRDAAFFSCSSTLTPIGSVCY